MKRIYFVVLGALVLALAGVAVINIVQAEENSSAAATGATIAPLPPNIKDIAEKDLRQELSIKEIKGRVLCSEVGACVGDAKSSTEVLIKSAKVTEVGADLIKISIFGISYKVDIKEAKLVRNYWGGSEIDEFSVGDIINVFGYLDENDNFLIHAKTVRDVSIQKVHNVFKGVIESIDAASNTFVLQTEERGNQTVVVSSDTKIIKATSTASFSDLQVGMKVIVRGLWDKTLSKIQARLIIVGDEKSFRPFFKKAWPTKVEKLEGKIEKFTEKAETKVGESAKEIKARIEELQKKITEILEKLKTATSTAPATQ
jgi:hypothetical protein